MQRGDCEEALGWYSEDAGRRVEQSTGEGARVSKDEGAELRGTRMEEQGGKGGGAREQG